MQVDKKAQSKLDSSEQKESAISSIPKFNPIAESLKIVAPSWPLQSLVAVNPFWFRRGEHITEVFHDLSPMLKQNLFMPLSYYAEKYRKGEISNRSLELALSKAQTIWPNLSIKLDRLKRHISESEEAFVTVELASEWLPPSNYIHLKTIENIGKYCAGFFDSKQASVRYPWQSGSFWEGWFEAQTYDRRMISQGIQSFRNTVDLFRKQTPEYALQYIFKNMSLDDPLAQNIYCKKLLLSMIGWASEFKYIEWQESLGETKQLDARLLDFLAVRMIYDFAVYRDYKLKHDVRANNWVANLIEVSRSLSEDSNYFKSHYIWHLAYEFTMQDRVVASLKQPKPAIHRTYNTQMVFCIDVRSEVIRRHIENTNSRIQTIGFAGFFGVPITYKKIDQKRREKRLPVLLAPSITLMEGDSNKDLKQQERILLWTYIRSYFRSLRKASLGSFLYVEIFGVLTIFKLLGKTIASIFNKTTSANNLSRFKSNKMGVQINAHSHINTDQKIERAEYILTHMGLTESFSPLVVFCGHGSKTENNALASALDCGACGGYAGDVNARFAANLLNDTLVREKLASRGIKIPSETFFTGAIHETVTDTIEFLDEELVPKTHRQHLVELKHNLKTASFYTARERNTARSRKLDPLPYRRSSNWSELRPEWGLSGNAHFIVAPRQRTRQMNLEGRSFLHDYSWHKDKNFQTLELIMTAPMVVTNWINLQYYSSVVAPDHFGSGNKVIHNITGESGVIEGNCGDLRIGLPIQSVHDGEKYIHDPLRLSVFIEAPREAIEDIIRRHDTVRDLIENEWLHVLQIGESGNVSRRGSHGKYELVVGI